MGKIENNWYKVLALLAIVLSITALFRCEPFEFRESWLMWSVGASTSVLGIAITAAVAIQVYNSVVSEKKLQNIMEKKIAENKKYTEMKTEETRQEFLSLLYVTQAQRSLINKDYRAALDILMRALVHAKECSCKAAYNTTVQALKELIKIIQSDNIDLSISEESKLWYQCELDKINDKIIVEVEKFIINIKTTPPLIPKEVEELLQPFKKE